MLRIIFLGSLISIGFEACTSSDAAQPPKNNRLPYYNTPDFTPVFASSPQAVAHSIADFSFTDQNGQTITQKSIDGKIHVADFFFTSCGSICPRMTNNMMKVNEAFANDDRLVLLSYSVTPWIDSVQRLKEYADRHVITNDNWHFLTGSKSKIYDLARKSYFAEEELGYTKDSTEFLHTEHFLLVDKNKKIRGIYNGTLETEVQQLIADIRELEKE